MPGKSRIIIDTDPGLDDVLAMLYAFAAKREELEIALISLTFGNVDVQNCLKNVMSTFHAINREQEWRQQNDRPRGFEALEAAPPIVALGADKPVQDQIIMADFFHAWRNLFNVAKDDPEPTSDLPAGSNVAKTAEEHRLFTPSTLPAHKVMLQLLRDNPPDSFTIVAIGPLTNLALAAAEDVETFLRVKNVVVMGGTIDAPGNITPLGEFNTHADTIAFSRILSLTSPNPHTTVPVQPSPHDPTISTASNTLPPYPYPFPSPKRLRLTLVPLDITTPHLLTESHFSSKVRPIAENGSPLAGWVTAFMKHAWRKTSDESGLALHDPLAVWVAQDLEHVGWIDDRAGSVGGMGGGSRVGGVGALSSKDAGGSTSDTPSERGDSEPIFTLQPSTDMRVETAGQWTRGACVVDRRGKAKPREWGTGRETAERQARDSAGDGGNAGLGPDAEESPSDRGGWKNDAKGNRVDVLVGTPVWPMRTESTQSQTQTHTQIPHDEVFAEKLMARVFAVG
ncbi:MAG: hypothetical protein M1831_005833 [Alyxoria varia]|nr:MAG: hypothetical protein M1831_005833 [Alyxoria varia]